MEIKLALCTESLCSGNPEIIHVTLTEDDLEALMQKWIDDRYNDTVLTSLSVDSIKP